MLKSSMKQNYRLLSKCRWPSTKQVLSTKKERKSALKKLRYYVSPKAVFPASERKYTATGGDVEVPWDGIHEWRKSEQRDWYTNWYSKRSFAWALLLRGDQTESFQFLNWPLFRSSPMVMNLRWRLKNAVKRMNGRDGIFAKSSRCDTSWQIARV